MLLEPSVSVRVVRRLGVAAAICLLRTFGPPDGAQAQLTDLGSRFLNECAPPGDCFANELFASALAVCDFNDDGFADLAVGVPQETVGPNESAGSLHIFYGSLAGLTEDGDQVFDLDDLDLSGGADAGDALGSALAAGDFDRDGICDLAAGAPGKSVGAPGNHAGAAIVLFGSTDGLTGDGFRFLSQNHLPPGSSESAETNDGFGSALAALPNGGLAIGVPSEDFFLTSEVGAGLVQVLSTSAPGSPLDSVVDREQNDFLGPCSEGNEVSDLWGSTLAVGRFSGSSSLVVAGDFEHLAGQEDAGRVTVIGSPTQCFDQNSPDVGDSAEAFDHFGKALATGDFDDDGFDELAIGAPFEDLESSGDTGAGIVHVLLGAAGGLGTAGIHHFNQESFPNSAPEDGDNFGDALAAGDFDGDGFDDLAIGAPSESIGAATAAGAVNVRYGTANGLSSANSQLFQSDSPAGMPDIVESNDRFGAALAAGDFDNNGIDDLAIGVPGESSSSASALGALTVVYGLDRAIGAFGEVEFTSSNLSFPEAPGNRIVVLARSGGAVVPASVSHFRAGGSATPGTDFNYTAGVENWDAGELGAEFFAFSVDADTLDENNETVLLQLSDPSAGLALGASSTITITIEDDDEGGVLQYSQPVYAVAEDAGVVQLPVIRSGGSASGVTVAFATSNASAEGGEDFIAQSGTLSYAANETLKVISVQLLDDGEAEGPQVFNVTLTNPGGGSTLGTFTVAQVVIVDNEIFLDGFEIGDTSRWSAVVP